MRRASYQFNNNSADKSPTLEQDMLNVGIDIVPDRRNLAGKREKQGKCPTCGNATHKVGLLGKKAPLTVEGKVYKGRCLVCHPLEGYSLRPASAPCYSASSTIPVTASTSPRGRYQQQQQHTLQQQQQQPQPHIYPAMGASAQPLPFSQSERIFRPPVMRQPIRSVQLGMQMRQPDIQQNGYLPHAASGVPPAAVLVVPVDSYGHTQDSILVPRTLEVDEDDHSIVSALTLDFRTTDDDLSIPPVSRRPGPENLESNSDFYRPARNWPGSMRRFPTRPGMTIRPGAIPLDYVIQEEEEYDAVQSPTGAPLGLDPSAVGGGWDRQADIDDILNRPRGGHSASPSRNYIDEIVFQPPPSRDIAVETSPTAESTPAIPLDYNPQHTLQMSQIPPQQNTRNHQESLSTAQQLIDEGPNLDRFEGAGTSYVSPRDVAFLNQPLLRMRQISAPGGLPIESQSTYSSAPPLRKLDARGRADSGRIHDPMMKEDSHLSGAANEKPHTSQEVVVASPSDDPVPRSSSTRRGERKQQREAERKERKAKIEKVREMAVEPLAVSPPRPNTPSKGRKTPPPVDGKEITKPSTPSGAKSSKKKKQTNVVKDSTTSEKKKQKQRKMDMHEIPSILHCLNLDQCDSHMREKALDSLAAILCRSSSKGREFILEHHGVDTVSKSMWSDMENPQVQGAAMHLILAMAASPDGIATNDMLSNEESICDSVLFTMQNHANVPEIQLSGCLIFACLAGASSDNKTTSDGSLSGAVLMVLNAMNNHQKDLSVQKAGVHALYRLCSVSIHAEGNKRNLMESELDGVLGLEVVLKAMEELQEDYMAMEWAFKICWYLTSSEDLVKASAEIPLHDAIVPICERHMANPAAMDLVEAALGAVGNLAHLGRMREELAVGAVGMIVEALQSYSYDFGISYEAIASIANLCFSSFARDSLVKSGAVPLVVMSLQHFIDIPEYTGEGIRALVCLAVGSQEAKKNILASGDIIKTIIEASNRHGTLAVQQMCSLLISTLAVDPAACDLLVEYGAIRVILHAMDCFADLKLQEAGCSALRNIFSQVQVTDKLLEQGDTEKVLVNAMDSHKNSVSIQKNGCSAFWNLIYKSEEPEMVATSDGVKCIVRAMQSQMESSELLEQACGALWTFVDVSEERKKDVVGNGAVDAVTCALVMHLGTPSILEKACGVLSNMSSEAPLAEAIADAQGVGIVAEAIRNNSTCVSLLEVGCLTLRNIAFLLDVAQEASAVISTVVNAMEDNIDAVDFQKEACNLLWILAAEDPSCHSKILALDGLSVLIKCLEANRDDSELQEAALGAFNTLSFTNLDTLG